MSDAAAAPCGNDAPSLPARKRSAPPDETAREEAATDPAAGLARTEPTSGESPPPVVSALETTAASSQHAVPPLVAGIALLFTALHVLAHAVHRLVTRNGQDVFAWLSDDDVLRILTMLLPADRANCASVSRRFRALLRRPEAWAVIDASASDSVDAQRGILDDTKLMNASVRACALRVLNTEGAAAHISSAAVSGALEGLDSGTGAPAGARLESLTVFSLAPLHDTDAMSFSRFVCVEPNVSRFFLPEKVECFAAACPRLRSAAVGVFASNVTEGVRALHALDTLPRDGAKALVLCLPLRDSPAVRADVDAFAEALATNSSLHALAVARQGQHPMLPRTRPWWGEDYDRDGLDTYNDYNGEEPFRWNDASRLAQYVAARLADALRRNTTLTALDLSTNGIGDAGVRSLCGALAEAGGRSSLSQLFLMNTGLREQGAAALAELVASPISPLRKLCLDDNYLAERAVNVLMDGLRSEHCRLRVLSAQRLNRMMAPPLPLLSFVAHALLANRSLEVLDIGRNGNFGDNSTDAAMRLADALLVNSTLTTLKMLPIELEGAGVDLLLLALQRNTGLRDLTLSAMPSPFSVRSNAARPLLPPATHPLGRRFAKAALAKNTSLRQLELHGALPTALGGDAAALVAGLARNTTLTVLNLDLGADGLGRGAGATMGAALAAPRCTLRNLALACHGSKLHGGDVAALSRGLAANTSLECLKLNFCGVCPRGGASLASALAANSTLRSCELFGNGVGDAGARAFADALRVNNTLNVLMLFFPPTLNPGWTRAEQRRRAETLALGGLDYHMQVDPPPWVPNDIGADAAAELRAAAARRRVVLEPRMRAPDTRAGHAQKSVASV